MVYDGLVSEETSLFYHDTLPKDQETGMEMDFDPKRMKERIAAIKKAHPNYQGILEFFEKLLLEQLKTMAKVEYRPLAINEDRARLRAREGFPILSKGDFPIDPRLAGQLFRSICRIAKGENEKLKVEVGKIARALRQKKIDLEICLKKAIEGDRDYLSRIAADVGIDQGVMNFLLHTSIKPFVEVMASHLRDKVDEDLWDKGYCPICGSQPLMGELRGEEGKRVWTCSFCGNQWRGKRLMCPFCENTDHRTLRYFYTEKERAYRIDVCDKCKKYIKTVDSRQLSDEIFLPVEDLATLHLDILAADKGFKRESFDFLGIF
jgi:FdhE protein